MVRCPPAGEGEGEGEGDEEVRTVLRSPHDGRTARKQMQQWLDALKVGDRQARLPFRCQDLVAPPRACACGLPASAPLGRGRRGDKKASPPSCARRKALPPPESPCVP